MAGFKRKEAPTFKPSGGSTTKKAKKEGSHSNRSVHIQETETDSEPIVESDTTEHSGDDDGVTWPSDEGEEETQVKKPANTSEQEGMIVTHPSKVSSSRESHAKQKIAVQERKAAKPNADTIARSKKLWERLRRKSHVPLVERKELVAELFDIISSRVKEFVLKHDSVRVVQTALKYANIDQRKMIARELKGQYRGLAESKYAKFLIGKILVHGDEEIRDMVVPEFYGHVRQMIKHPEASWILDDVYRGIATPRQKANLLREWYGAEFAIFKMGGEASPSADLHDLLEKTPEKRTPIMRSLYDLINALIQKKSTGFTMLHDAMLQYYLNVQLESKDAKEFMEMLKGDEEGDLLKNLAFTKSGARLVCLALAHGTAKDRKLILKTYKTLIQTLAYDPYGHQILLATYDLIDDTVLTAKSIFPELVGNDPESEEQNQTLLALAVHRNARIALLYPFSGSSKAFLPEEDQAILREIHRIRIQTSKKDTSTRRKELVTALSPSLLTFIAFNAKSLVQTSFGCQFMSEVLLSAIGDREPALNAVAALVQGSAESRASLDSPAAGRMLKSLVQGGHFNPETKVIDPADPPLGFHDILYNNIKDEIVDWAIGRNSFVVLGLVEAAGFSKVVSLKKALKKNREKLLQAASDKVETPQADESSSSGMKKAKHLGNRGTQLLLSKIGG